MAPPAESLQVCRVVLRAALEQRLDMVNLITVFFAGLAPEIVPPENPPPQPRPPPPVQLGMLATHAAPATYIRGPVPDRFGSLDTAPAANVSAAATSSRLVLLAASIFASRKDP